jgi:hypothetical protein
MNNTYAPEELVTYAVMLRNDSSLWARTSRVATQRCGKHISAAVNQRATIWETVFSMGAAPRLYNENLTQPELELRESAVERD